MFNSYADPRRNSTCKPAINANGVQSDLPPSLPLSALAQTMAFWRSPHTYLEMCRRLYGRRFTIYPIGAAPMVFMSHPEDISSIIRARPDVLRSGSGARVITPLVGERSFMLQDGDDHLRVRRAVMPAFHHRVVAAHAQAVRRITIKEIEAWPVGRPFAAHPRLRALTLRVILNTIFGSEDPRLGELHASLFSMLAITGSLALQEPPLRILPPWHRIWRSFRKARARVDELLRNLIADEAHAAAEESGLLSQLFAVHSQRPNERENIRDDLMSVILAGHETTASQLAWGLQLLAHNRTAAAALTDEIDRAGEFPYLTATVQEIMRHRPVFLFAIPRVINKPLRIAGALYGPPVQLVGCIHLLHHDPELYHKPNSFLPERFIDSPPDPRFWLPWGGGRKRCPGHSLATLEIQTVLHEILSRWSILPAGHKPESASWRSVIVTPRGGCRVILHRRDAVSVGRFRLPRCYK